MSKTSARDDIAELVQMIVRGLGFVQFTVVDAQKPHHLTVEQGSSYDDNRHRVWAEGIQRLCDAAAPFCSGNTKIAQVNQGRIEIRIPDPDTASELLRFTRAFYASPVHTVTEFAAVYQP
jgi:hypothetical protein